MSKLNEVVEIVKGLLRQPQSIERDKSIGNRLRSIQEHMTGYPCSIWLKKLPMTEKEIDRFLCASGFTEGCRAFEHGCVCGPMITNRLGGKHAQ